MLCKEFTKPAVSVLSTHPPTNLNTFTKINKNKQTSECYPDATNRRQVRHGVSMQLCTCTSMQLRTCTSLQLRTCTSMQFCICLLPVCKHQRIILVLWWKVFGCQSNASFVSHVSGMLKPRGGVRVRVIKKVSYFTLLSPREHYDLRSGYVLRSDSPHLNPFKHAFLK